MRNLISFVVFFLTLNPCGRAGASLAQTPHRELTAAQKLRADRMISIFENGTQTIQYGYVEDLHDGRGYTSGRAGFCTGTGDLLVVVQAYQALVPKNPLTPFLPRLRELAALASDSTVGLEKYPAAFAAAAKDPRFRKIQDQMQDQIYYAPAVELFNSWNLKNPVTLFALYETGIQFGWGTDNRSVASMAEEAKTWLTANGQAFDEVAWLKRFLTLRRDTLASSPIPAIQESVGRGNEMLKILADGNLDFHGPITTAPYDPNDVFVVP